MWANKPTMAKKWTKKYGSYGTLKGKLKSMRGKKNAQKTT